MKKNYRETLNEIIKDPEFKKEWDELEPEYQLIQSMISARIEKGMTQKQLSELTGITQADISRIEGGNYNPFFRTLKRIAYGLGKKLIVRFE